MKDYTGRTIVNGELHHVSVSSVKAFDIRTKGGCARRWAYRKVFGNTADDFMNTAAKDKGTALDKELKNYLATGDKTLSSLALKGLHILEAPGPDLKLDLAINTCAHYLPDGTQIPSLPDGEHDKYPPGTKHVVTSALTAAGVPFVGELDMAHERGHFRNDDGEYEQDPPGTVEVADIKFKTNATDAKGNSLYFLPTDMIRDVQMAGYGEWVSRVRPNTTHVRLSMLYFPEKKGLPTKVTRLHVLEDFHKKWAHVESVVREMKDVARVTDIEHVPGAPDISTCDAYAGCPHRDYCTAYRSNSLDKTYGKIATDHANNSPGWSVEPAPQAKVNEMGLLSSTPGLIAGANAPQPDMRQQLADEEARQRAVVAQQQQQMPQQLNTAELQQVVIRLQGYGYGFPTLAGNAAQAYAVLGGQNIAPGTTYPGQPAQAGAKRSLHGIQLTEVAHIYQLEGELAKEAAQNAPAPFIQPAPPPMPPPMPAYTAPVQAPPVMKTMDAPGLSFLPPDAPQSMPALAMQHAPAPQQVEGVANYIPAAPEAQKPGRGRPKKAQDVALGSTAAGAIAPQQAVPASQPAPASQVAPVSSSPIEAPVTPDASFGPASVLVNARANTPTKSLSPYVDYINAELSKRYCVSADGKPGVQDVRCAPKDSPLAFGGWKGAVREVVKSDPPPIGDYHLDTFTDELAEVVADALRVVAEQRGWLYIRGVRV